MPDVKAMLTYVLTVIASPEVLHLPTKRGEEIATSKSLGNRKALLETYPHVLSEYVASENKPIIAYTFRNDDGDWLHVETDPYTNDVLSAGVIDIRSILDKVTAKKSATLSLALAVPKCPYMPLYIKGETPSA